jgi:hypothetical protein
VGKQGHRKRTRQAARNSSVRPGPLNADLTDVLEGQLARFREKFGRDPQQDDPLFFNPDADTPERLTAPQDDALEQEMIAAMVEAGIDASLIYAYRKTGRIVTEQNAHLLSDEARLEWNAALDEYARLSKDQRG